MDWYDLREFREQLLHLRSFLFEVASNTDRLSIEGLRGLRRLNGYEEALSTLPEIETKLLGCERLAAFLDTEIATRVSQISNKSALIAFAPEMRLTFELSEKKKSHVSVLSALRTSIAIFGRPFGFALAESPFDDSGTLPVRKMIIEIDRLLPLLLRLEGLHYSRTSNDEEIFKPSNVNIVDIRVFIDKAIISIERNQDIDAATRKKLDEYLSEAKAELGKDNPAWKKLVGALVIVSAILGGIAIAPEALANVNSAVKYILGTSVESTMPKPSFGPGELPALEDT